MSSYNPGFAALTEKKRSTYRMLLSLSHHTEQHIKRSNQAELQLMSSFRISRTNQIRSFHWGFPLEKNLDAN